MNKNIFVSGARGFIGSNLVKKLSKNGYYVNAAHVDILDENVLSQALDGIDTVFHCAAVIDFGGRDPKRSHDVNVTGTKNILALSAKHGVKKIVFVSAAGILGYTRSPSEKIGETSSFQVSDRNTYLHTKKMAEDAALSFARGGMDISIASVSTVYGPGDRKMNSGSIIRSVLANGMRFCPPGGTSYVSAADLADGLLLVAEKGAPGQRYIFSSENLKYSELINRIAAALNRSPVEYILPEWTRVPAECAAACAEFFIGRLGGGVNLITPEIIKESYFYKYYDSTKARKELGWEPKVSLEDSVLEAVEFYRKEGLLK